MKRVLPILVLALAIPTLVNCKKEEKDEPTPPPPVKVETISVNPDKIEINDGDTRNLSVTVAPANAENINEIVSSIVWSSADKEIASVDGTGLMTAHMRGETTISAATPDGRLKAVCNVTVKLNLTDDKDITVYFDPLFASALQKEKLIKDALKVTYADVKNIKEVWGLSKNEPSLSSIKGVEFLTSLELLNISGCKNITEVDLSTCARLKDFRASDCTLTTLDLSNCPALETIKATDGKLTEVRLPAENKNLNRVDFSKNFLKKLDLGNSPKLEWMFLDYNELEDVNLKGCTSLKRLNILFNKLKSIDLGEITGIDYSLFAYNPGENGVFKTYNKYATFYGWSWQMTPGDDRTTVKGMYYCDNAPKIKTQPVSVTVSEGQEFHFTVEMESYTKTLSYQWGLCEYRVNDDGVKYLLLPTPGLPGLFDEDLSISSGKDLLCVSGGLTNTLSMALGGEYLKQFKEQYKDCMFVCIVYDSEKKTTTYSEPASMTFK